MNRSDIADHIVRVKQFALPPLFANTNETCARDRVLISGKERRFVALHCLINGCGAHQTSHGKGAWGLPCEKRPGREGEHSLSSRALGKN